MSEPARDPLYAQPAGDRATIFHDEHEIDTARLGQLAGRVGKALMDIVLGTILAVVAVPVIGAFAVILAVRLGQWPFFWHRRVGQHGRPIMFPKLRTLPKTTPRYALKDGGDVIPVDRFTAFLRRRHLDELPQLLLVPVLKMSLVGPRPKMPDRFEPTDPGYRDARQLVRQGCTGLWQIGHESHYLVHERPEYDFCYLQYGSLRMDLWILWRTALLVIGGRTIRLAGVPRWVLGAGWVSEGRIRAVGGARFLITRDRLTPGRRSAA